MDAVLKANWVAALRSGEFKQGKRKLYRAGDDSYCCLGVFAKINGMSLKDNGVGTQTEEYLAIEQKIGCSHTTLVNLIHLNDGAYDGRARSFPEIADYIEENL